MLRFNDSTVMDLLRATGISIHPMLRFNTKPLTFGTVKTIISIHPMLRFNKLKFIWEGFFM